MPTSKRSKILDERDDLYTMTIYFIRHAESVDASKGLYQRDETPLSTYGTNQAKEIANKLTTYGINSILSSPLRRASETAQIINQRLCLPLTFNNLLAEERRPSEILGLEKSNPYAQNIIELIEKNYHKIGFKYSDEESFSELKSRISSLKRFLESLPDKNYLIVSHGIVLKMLEAIITVGESVNSTEYRNIWAGVDIANTEIRTLLYTNRSWSTPDENCVTYSQKQWIDLAGLIKVPKGKNALKARVAMEKTYQRF